MSSEKAREESLREHSEMLEHWGEKPRSDPKADEHSDQLAEKAGLPGEADRRDRA